MATIEKVVFTSVSMINGKPKITLKFSNGEVYTFIEGIDNCFKTIVNLVNMKRKAHNIELTTDTIEFKENRKGVYLVYKLDFTENKTKSTSATPNWNVDKKAVIRRINALYGSER